MAQPGQLLLPLEKAEKREEAKRDFRNAISLAAVFIRIQYVAPPPIVFAGVNWKIFLCCIRVAAVAASKIAPEDHVDRVSHKKRILFVY